MQGEITKKEFPIRQIVIVFIIVYFILSILGTLVLGVFLAGTAKCKKVEKVLLDTPHNQNVYYISNDSFYSNGKKIDIPDECRILLVDNDYVYLSKRVKGKQFDVFRADHSLENFEKIIQVEGSGYMTMVNSNTLVYGTSVTGASVYHLDTQKTETYSELLHGTVCDMFRSFNYKITEQRKDGMCCFEIKEKTTTEIRLIDENDRSQLKTQKIIKDVEKTSGKEVIYYGVIEQNGKLYFQCIAVVGVFEGIILTYQYDFETEEFSFVDWIYVDDIEGCRTYIINN